MENLKENWMSLSILVVLFLVGVYGMLSVRENTPVGQVMEFTGSQAASPTPTDKWDFSGSLQGWEASPKKGQTGFHKYYNKAEYHGLSGGSVLMIGCYSPVNLTKKVTLPSAPKSLNFMTLENFGQKSRLKVTINQKTVLDVCAQSTKQSWEQKKWFNLSANIPPEFKDQTVDITVSASLCPGQGCSGVERWIDNIYIVNGSNLSTPITPPVLQVPQITNAQRSGNSVTLTWTTIPNPSTGTTYYHVWRTTSNTFTGQTLMTSEGIWNPMPITPTMSRTVDATPSTNRYYYWVRGSGDVSKTSSPRCVAGTGAGQGC